MHGYIIYIKCNKSSTWKYIYDNFYKNINIIRSTSRVAIPTDNPKIELINGWVKDEMYSEKWHKRYD